MRKVFLDELPHIDNQRICWADSIGYILEFTYDDLNDHFTILDYRTNGSNPQVYLDYKGNAEWVYTSRLLHCKIANLIKVKKKANSKTIDLTGQRFGKLVVLEDDGTRSNAGQIKWKCLCDCGATTHVVGYKLKNGYTKSCGCIYGIYFKSKSHTLEDFHKTSVSRILARYKSKAKERQLVWEIDRNTFKNTIEQPCHYCGTLGSLTMNIQDYQYNHNGIDRIDSNKGYTQFNIVPCCKICNMAKSNLSQKEFYDWVQKISKNFSIDKIKGN